MAETHEHGQPAEPHLYLWVKVAVAAVALCLVGGIVLLPTFVRQVRLPELRGLLASETPPAMARLRDEYKRSPLTYGPVVIESPPLREKIPIAQPVPGSATATVTKKAPEGEPAPGPALQASVFGDLFAFGQGKGRAATDIKPSTHEGATETTAQGQPIKKEPKYKPWLFKTPPTKGNLENGTGMPKAEPTKAALEQQGQAAGLVKRAAFVIPHKPLQTLYRSQRLTGQLLDSINSDIPSSTIRILVTTPALDRFGYDRVIIPKDSVIIAQQVGKAEFGQSRLGLKIDQLEFPNGAIVDLEAMAGDENGAAGVPAKVNAHLGKLLLATTINAVLQFGLGKGTGVPNGFYQSPEQQAAKEAGRAVAEDVNSYTKQVLRVPPTLEREKGAFVTILLQKNLQFADKPLVVR